jgi:crotonobetainyl-CoA:carnitine CoA-transferase CaiB-like acyl-CoA transferase
LKLETLKLETVSLLAPYRVLDLTGPLGYMCGRVLADLGADVVKVEPPGGDPERRHAPTTGTPDGPRSVFWLFCNANKRGITLDLNDALGRQRFRDLAARADFVLESAAPGTLSASGLGYAALSHLNPRLIYVSITPFGQQGPYRDYRASDIEVMAMAGAMSLAGEAGGEPMRITLPQAPMFTGLEAAMGALTALAARHLTGRGQHVDVSAQQAVIGALAHAPACFDLNREVPERTGIYVTGRTVTGAKMRVFWPCRDGWINFILYGGDAGRRSNQQLATWMAEKGCAPDWFQAIDWKKFEVPPLTQEQVDRLEAPIAGFFANLTKREFYDGATAREILGYPVSTVEDIAQDPQLAARDFWHKMPLVNGGPEVVFPGSFAVVNGARLPIVRPAPRPGEHNDEIFAAPPPAQAREAGKGTALAVPSV